MMRCERKAFVGTFVSILILFLLASTGHYAYAQITPVTQYDCDPRSTVNGGACPTGCNFAPTVEKGCNCFDSIDNDGDGKVDAADISDCAQYFGLAFIGPGTSNCSIIPPGGNVFAGIGAPAVSQQNTADTQSKVAAGDMTGDGVPETVITSKWNNEVRVVNPNGTINASYNLSGKKSLFSEFTDVDGKTAEPDRLLLEHEVLIADIKRSAALNPDGKGEIFAIVSARKGNPKTPPTGFYLLALTWTKPDPNGLVLLYDPIPLGTNRPGIFGIADMDGDGFAEIYLRDRIYAAETGKLLASEGSKTHLNTSLWDSDVTSAPVAVSVTGDSKMELICGTKIYTIPTLTNRNPASPSALTLVKDMNVDFPATKCFVKLMNDPTEYGIDTHSSTSVADIDEDGFLDIVISGALNSTVGRTAVFYWNVQKNFVSHKVTPSSTELGLAVANPNYANYSTGWIWGTGRVNIGDANGDGKPDLSFIAGNQLFSLTTDGTGTNLVTLWTQNSVNTATGAIGYRTINDSRSGVLTVTIYDFNNDGNPEMVYRDSQSLNIIDGATGQNLIWSTICQSHTYTEGPIIADVNGDGATDICVTCNTSNSFDITDDIQQQALGQVRMYFSNGNQWLPTRKVWNQPGYFVVNINDDLTLPFPQLSQILSFGNDPCPNGIPGPNQPFNVFLNQVPYLNANGCPVFPAPDLTFVGDIPGAGDTDGDGIIRPAVIVTPPICGNLDITAQIRYGNIGDIPISDAVPVSFFKGDPRLPGAIRLHNTTINIVNLAPGSDVLSPPIVFNGTGETFQMFIALYNDGAVLPIPASGQTTKECQITNNVYQVTVTPSPFTTQINKFKDNVKCVASDPNAGELRARVFIGATEVFDFSPYAFQWYAGVGTTNPIAAAQGGQNPIITGLVEGDYTLVVTNTQKGCTAAPVGETILLDIVIPAVTVTVLSDQTQCNPPNGKLSALVEGGNTGYSFEWFSLSGAIGITTSVADGLIGDSYIVRVKRTGTEDCIAIGNATIKDEAFEPDAVGEVLQNVVNCSNPNSGSINGKAFIGLDEQNPADYTFNWYFYNNVADTRGSILPAINGTGPTRTGLAVGFYELEVINNATQCVSLPKVVVEITDSTILPEALITETSPQTSCDPLNPNGVLTASVQIAGVPQNPADFTFEWFRGDNTLPANLHTTVSGVNGNVAEKVAGGGVFYTVKVTSALNCSDTEKLIISEDVNLPVITLTPTDNSICDPTLAGTNFNGSMSAAVTFKGVAVTDFTDYKFTWHDGTQLTDPLIVVANDKNPILSQLDNGYYTATVERISLGCKSIPDTEEVENVSLPPVITTNAIGSTNCDPALANGQAIVTQVDGAGTGVPYVFQWHTGQNIASPIGGATSPILANRQGAVGAFFTVLVTNQTNGCVNTATVEIPDNRVIPVVTLAQTPNSICDATLTNPSVNFNGTATASITNLIGDITSYRFTWRNGQLVSDPENTTSIIQNLNNLNGGYYTTTALHNPTGCISAPTTIQVLNNPLIPVITSNAIGSTNCDPTLANGQALITDVDGVGTGSPYIFQWHTGQTIAAPIGGATAPTLANRQGAVGAFFTALVTNQNNGCQNTATIEIPDNRVIPVVTLAQTPNGICDASLTNPASSFNGTATATVTNLLPGNYFFTWRNGQLITDPINNSSTNQNLIDLNGGYYTTTTIHEPSGCVSAPVTVQVINDLFIPVITSNAIGSTNCDPSIPNGQALITDVDGVGTGAPYIFQWHTGQTTTTAIGGATTPVLANRQGAVGAFFTALVTNQVNGCQSTATVEVPDNRVLPVVSLATTPNTICNPALTNPLQPFSGTVTATVTNQIGAISDYTFAWKDDETNTPLAGQTTRFLIDRDSSQYSVVATHLVTGCVSSIVNARVQNATSLPAVLMGALGSTNCDPTIPNGKALVASVDTTPVPDPSGILPPYVFEWFSGNTTTTLIAGANDGILENRQGAAGSFFTARVTNQSNGCQNTAIVEVPDNRVIPVVTLATTPNAICNPALTNPFQNFTGTITATVTNQIGAIADYSFAWTDKETNTPIGGITTQQLLNRDSSLYSVIATHTVTGCVSTPANAQILNITSLPAIVMSAVPSTNCDPTLPNGLAVVSSVDLTPVPAPSGLLSPYVFEWFTGNSTTTVIGGAADGILENRQGGIGSFFTTRVTNQSNGCRNTSVVEVPDNQSLPVITLTSTPNENCSAPFSGTASVNTITYKGNAEGLAGYSFNWTHGATTSTAPNLGLGTYELRVRRLDVGCVSDPVQVDVDDDLYIPAIQFGVTNQTSCDPANPNGAITASMDETSIGGGASVTGGYTYQWTNDGNPFVPGGPAVGNSSSLTGQAGNLFYTLSVERTLTRCVNTETVFLPERILLPRIELIATDIINCTTPGFVTAKVFIDNNNDGDTNDIGDELTPAQIDAEYTFEWHRGPTLLGPLLTETDKILNNLSAGIPLPADSYTAIATNTLTFCKSSDFTDVIQGPGPLFDLDFEINNRPASCADQDGVVTAFVDSGGGVPEAFGNYTFQWFQGNPTNGIQSPPASFYTDPQVQFITPALDVDPNSLFGNVYPGAVQPQAPTSVNTGPTLFGRTSGTYSVVVTRNADQCKEYKTVFLPFLTEPVIILAKIKPDECVGDVGEIEVELSAPNPVNQYFIEVYNSANPVLGVDIPTGQITSAAPTGNLFPNLASGIYTVIARENPALITTGCYSSPILTQLVESLPPKVDILGASANSTCVASPDPGDGSLQVRVSTDENDPFSPLYPALPPPASIDKGVSPFVTYSIDVKDAGNNSVPGYPTGSTFITGDNTTINGLRGELYNIIITSSKGCVTIKPFTVPDAPRVASLDGDVDVLPALACDPLLENNASIEIKNLAINGAAEICGNGIDDDNDGLIDANDPDCNDNLSDYQFSWFTEATLTTNILTANGNNDPTLKGGEVLSNTGAPLPTTRVTVGSYWVRANKVNAGATGGVGCLSAPLKVDIEDQSVKPTAVLTPFANTACDLAFEGSINLVVSNPGSVASATYDYDWTSTPAASPIANATGNGDGLLTDDNYGNLSDGTYTLSFKNNASGCIGFAQTSIVKAATPVVVANASHVDQFLCNPDGSITVGANDILVGGAIDTDHTRFDFTWSRNDVNTIVLGPTQGIDVLDIGNLPTIASGSYFVKVKKRPGLVPGSGCESAPFRVDILDKSEDPTVSLTSLSNTACDTNFEGSVQVTVTHPGSVATPTYDYVWATPAASPIVSASSDGDGLGADDNFNNLSEGTYTLIAKNTTTGCEVIAQTIITKLATPIVITNATPINQLICNPDGSITVGTNDIQVGGVVDTDHTRFDFTWARNDINTIIVGPSQSADVIDINNVPTIGAGSYFVKVKKRPGLNPGSGCESAPFRTDILDISVDPTVTISSLSNTACDTNFEGSVQVTVTNPGSVATPTYDYVWASPAASPIASASSDGDGLGADDNFNNLSEGTYTVIAKNTTSGCEVIAQTIITKQATPVVVANASPVDQLICNPDGSIAVGTNDILVGGVVDTDHTRFDFTWTRNDINTIIVGPTQSADVIDINNVPTIGAGSYFVKVKKRPGLNPGSGCESAPFRVDIEDKSIDPTVTITSLSNTSCDTNFEGSVRVTVTNPGSVATPTYDYTWSAPVVSPIANAVSNGDGLGVDDNFANLSEGTYIVTAMNTVSGCVASVQTIITQVATPIVITNATAVDQLICNPDGSITVGTNDIQVGGVIDTDHTRFDFTWARNDINTIIVGPTQSADVIDINNVPTIGAGSYFVKVKKRPGLNPGSGCESAPFRVDIEDKSIDPTVTITSLSNTSCDTNFEGSVQVTVTNPGSVATLTYDYSWSAPVVSPIANAVSNGDGVGVDDNFANLSEGTYIVTAMNTVSGCVASAQTIITQLATPIVITNATAVDQLICNPDGSITVGTNDIQVGGVIDADHTRFDFTWTRNDINTIIVGPTQSADVIDINNVPTIGAGSYFVKVKKRPGLNPGSGCESAPFKVDIKDISEDPRTQFTFTPNSSCSSLLPNGIVLATASEVDPGIDPTTVNYAFSWLLNNQALPGTILQTDVSNTSELTDSPDGSYSLTVLNNDTGCSFLSGVNVTIDLSLSLPNIITVDTIEPTTCIGDGSAQVTSISIGGGPAQTGAAIAPPNFEYEWYDGKFIADSLLTAVTPLLTPIKTGTYFVRVKDLSTDCLSAPTEVVLNDLNIVYPSIEITLTTPQISCDETVFGTGVLVSTADGQTDANANYTFEWFPSLDLTGTSFATTSTIDSLRSGDYSLQVQNISTGCFADAIYIVPDNAPQFLPQLIVSASERTLCIGQDGSVFAGIVNIPPAYPFLPYDFTADLFVGDVVGNLPAQPDISDMNNVPGFTQNFATLDTLQQGFYTVRVIDNNTGCVAVRSVEVMDGRKLPVVDIVAENPNVNCDDTIANGQLAATADGNLVSGYQFDWFAGTTITDPTSPLVADNNRMIGFLAGNYTVRVTNELTGCVTDKTGQIIDGVVFPPAPTAVVERDRTNCVTPNGWVSANVNGQTINHIFNWFDGTGTKPASDFAGSDYFDRDIGPYTVTATDIITRCVSLPATVTVKDGRVFPIVEVKATAALCLTPTGSITMELINNQEVILTDITWFDEDTNDIVGRGPEVFELTAGYYRAELITSESCEGSADAEIETEILSYNLVSVNGDDKNDVWIIDCLQQFPGNNVKVFNRSGVKVYEADGYDNANVVFRGVGENGVYFLGDQLPDGTYFYIIDKRNGSKPITGYLELVR